MARWLLELRENHNMIKQLFSASRKPQTDVNWQVYLRWALFIGIMAVAAWMRLWRLGDVPPSIFRDEAEKALNGWFLLNGGVDAVGRPWPIFIKVFGVTTSAIYQYATIPFLAIGGLNEWTTRLPAACVGIATVGLTWELVRRIWNWQTAAWAAAMLAVSPWHVPLSRWAQQGIFLPLFFTAAAWAVAVFLSENASDKKPRARWLALAGACMGLAMYTYDPARLFAPLLALAAAVIWWRVWMKNWSAVLAGLVAFAVFVSPVIWLMLNQGDAAMARFKFLSIMQPGMTAGEVAGQFVRNYGSHFSMNFLLQTGDAELRHGTGDRLIGFVTFVGATTGVIHLFQRRDRWAIFLFVWILLAPIPASLTREGVPHALRSQMALPAWQCLGAWGLMAWFDLMRHGKSRNPAASVKWAKILAVMFALDIALGANALFNDYFGKYPQKSALNWQYGVKQSLQYLNQPWTQNAQVTFRNITGAEYLVAFYLKMDRPEYRRMLAGQTRYHFADPRSPLPNWLTNSPDAPAAVVAPWGVPRIEGSYTVFIDPPGQEYGSPAMQIFLTPELMDQVKQQSDQ